MRIVGAIKYLSCECGNWNVVKWSGALIVTTNLSHIYLISHLELRPWCYSNSRQKFKKKRWSHVRDLGGEIAEKSTLITSERRVSAAAFWDYWDYIRVFWQRSYKKSTEFKVRVRVPFQIEDFSPIFYAKKIIWEIRNGKAICLLRFRSESTKTTEESQPSEQ